MARIRAENLGKTYFDTSTEVEVIKEANLVIEPGDLLAVVGASGVGKSTLLYLLGALERPTSGKVYFDDQDIFSIESDRELAAFRNKKLGFVFQFHHLIPEFTALENVMMPALIARLPKAEAASRAKEAMELLGVGHRCDHKPGEISGGEQQRCAVARALVMRPEVVLADEPTGNLDTDTSLRLHEELIRLNEEQNTAFVIVTHDEQLAYSLPKVVKIDHGKIIPVRGFEDSISDGNMSNTTETKETL